MSKSYILASDLGSGSCKTLILNNSGQVVASVGAEYPTAYPQPGWVEQNPDDWYAAFAQTTRRVIAQAGITADQIAMVGLVAVTHNTVLLDHQDRPLRPCILTFDQRSGPQCQQILADWGDRVQRQARNSVTPLWTWPQLLWVKDNEFEVWQKVERILFQKDYVRHRLAPDYITN